MSMKDLLFSFEGRIGRKPFWLTLLAMVAVGILINVLVLGAMFAGAASADPEGGGGGAMGAVIMVVMVVLGVAMLWISLAVQAKRWHDLDKSAWWILINLVPAVGGLIALIMCGFMAGTQGPNQFGSASA